MNTAPLPPFPFYAAHPLILYSNVADPDLDQNRIQSLSFMKKKIYRFCSGLWIRISEETLDQDLDLNFHDPDPDPE